MSAGNNLRAALYQGRALREQKEAKRLKAVARAVANVEDGSATIRDAAEGAGVPVSTLSAALKKKREGR